MVKERAVIERDYADKLQSWHNRWTKTVKEGDKNYCQYWVHLGSQYINYAELFPSLQ